MMSKLPLLPLLPLWGVLCVQRLQALSLSLLSLMPLWGVVCASARTEPPAVRRYKPITCGGLSTATGTLCFGSGCCSQT